MSDAAWPVPAWVDSPCDFEVLCSAWALAVAFSTRGLFIDSISLEYSVAHVKVFDTLQESFYGCIMPSSS